MPYIYSKNKIKNGTARCYACGEKATSGEHIPPLCFFPKKKNLPGGIDYRNNLITVPSCDKHNSEKSADDEYLLAVITAHIDNNTTAEHHFHTKVIRALKRSSNMAIGFFGDIQPVVLNGLHTGICHIDIDRFNRSFELVGKGIFCHHYKKLAPNHADILSCALLSKNRPDINTALLEWRKYLLNALEHVPRYGDNQDVFYYQVVKDTVMNRFVIRITLYGGFIVDVILYNSMY